MYHFKSYSSEKYHNSGYGQLNLTVDPKLFNNNKELVLQEAERMRTIQKLKNKEFREQLKIEKKAKLAEQPKIPKKSGIPKSLKDKEQPLPPTLVDAIERKEYNLIKQLLEQIKYDPKVNLFLDPDTGNTCGIMGSSKRGKTKLIMRLFNQYYNHKKFITLLFCLNPQITDYSEKEIIKTRGYNSECSKLIRSCQYVNVKTKNKYRFLIMMDDIIIAKHDPIVNELCLTYRNSDISTILSVQYPVNISAPNRANINNFFIFDFNTDTCCNSAIELYLKDHFIRMGLKTDNERLEFFKEVTKDHSFIYLSPANNIISFHRLKLSEKEKDK